MIIVQVINKSHPQHEYSSRVNLRPYYPIKFNTREEAEQFLLNKGFTPKANSELWSKTPGKYGKQNEEAIAWIAQAIDSMVPMISDWQEGHAQ